MTWADPTRPRRRRTSSDSFDRYYNIGVKGVDNLLQVWWRDLFPPKQPETWQATATFGGELFAEVTASNEEEARRLLREKLGYDYEEFPYSPED